MAVALEVLQALATSFGAARLGPEQVQPGVPICFSVTPTSVDVTATDVVAAPLNLTWITKGVRFNNAQIEPAMNVIPFVPAALNALIAGGMPVRVPVVGNLVGTEQMPGVPGDLGQLAGSLPVPTEVPVSVTVQWSVLDELGAPVAGGFTAVPAGLDRAEVCLTFQPQVVELTNGMALPVVRRFLRARVTLSAGATNHAFNLPDIPVTIPAIAVPTVISFFLHTNFAAANGDDDGAAFIVVPNNSPLRNLAQLQSVLNTVESAVSSVTSIAEFASFLLGLNQLSSALAAQPHVQFRVANSSNHYNNFNNVTLIQRAWYENDTEAEDELSSLIFIGATGKAVECSNARNRGAGEGQFTLTIGPKFHATVNSLHSASPASGPDNTEIVINTAPPGGLFGTSSFGDELSSLRFL